MSHVRTPVDRERFAALLVAGTPLTVAAEQLGISRQTARRWTHDPDVIAALEEARREVRAAVSSRLAEFLSVALDRGDALLRDPDTPPQVLARLLGLALAESRLWIDAEEVLRRLDRLEAVHQQRDRLEELLQ